MVGTGTLVNPLQFGLALHHGGGYLFARSLRDQSLDVFFMAAAYGLAEPKRLPKSWLVSVGGDLRHGICTGRYFAGVPGAMGERSSASPGRC